MSASQMTHREAFVLGWVYGRILRSLPNKDKYDPSGFKLSQASQRPVSGMALIHDAAIQAHCMGKDIQMEIGEALSEIGETPDETSPISIELRGSWHLGYYNAISGKALEPDVLDIASLRKAKGLTQAQLAEMCGTTQAAIARWESGTVKPSPKSVQRLNEALKDEP